MNAQLKRFAKKLPPDWVNFFLYAYDVRFDPKRLFKSADIPDGTNACPRFLIDVTHQVRNSQRSGIPRVVAGISDELIRLESESEGAFRIVFAQLVNGTLFSAKRYEERLKALKAGELGRDREIRICPCDRILMIGGNFDRFHQLVPYFRRVKTQGGITASVLNDLMPFARPDWFPDDFRAVFERALPEIVAESDILCCVSETTKRDVVDWIKRNRPERLPEPRVTSFAQGAAVCETASKDEPIRAELREFLTAIEPGCAVFTQVSVLQPRKGQDFALDVFENRWNAGENDRLIYVGRKGWKADELYASIVNHPQRGRKFLFVENANERELALVYDRSTALISPSRGEGYGLPVVEGALRGLPVILSDLPVYREIAADAGFFFNLDDRAGFSRQLDAVRALPPEERRRRAGLIRIGTWRQGARDLLKAFEAFAAEREMGDLS